MKYLNFRNKRTYNVFFDRICVVKFIIETITENWGTQFDLRISQTKLIILKITNMIKKQI